MGPLSGMRVVELVGLGPGPFAGMLLADMGAEVVRVDRPGDAEEVDRSTPATNPMHRGKRSVAIDLQNPSGVASLLRLVDAADVFFEVFRPGVAERLGFGPDVCFDRNRRLVYGRLTGWGQDGPLAERAGHDIDYIALAGALDLFGRRGQPPTPPVNVLGDFAGGGMLLAFGVVCAAFEARSSGRGQVVDAAMIDGAALMVAPFFAARAGGSWGPRGTNFLDTGAHFYDVYETADARYLAVGAVEPKFYAELLSGLDIDESVLGPQYGQARWDESRQRLASVLSTRTRDEWCEVFGGTDACVAPVLSPEEAPDHPHHRARETFITLNGAPQPAPAPRLGRTPAGVPDPPAHPGADTDAVLADWGFTPEEIGALRREGAVI
jgi:alpha-methylacyl-CoA racemase